MKTTNRSPYCYETRSATSLDTRRWSSADGALVLETVRQVHADLLILDIMMPGLSGLEVYDRVREDPGVRDMPVLFVSANVPQFDSRVPQTEHHDRADQAVRPQRSARARAVPLPGVTGRRAGRAADATRYADLARVATETAVAVGEAIVQTDVQIVTRKKGRANFATAADHAAEKAVIERLAAHDPAVPVLAEESPKDALRKAERLWVVDPIDGTLNFSRAIPFYCVVIAYVEGGLTRAAAVHAPRTGETFTASEGRGATRNGVAISVGSVTKLSEAFAVASIGFGATKKKDSRFVALNSTCARLRVLGSAALEMCYVAMGTFDLFVHEFLSPWDIAASAFIAREAGASVLSLKTGKDAAWDEQQVVIANPKLAAEAWKLLSARRIDADAGVS